MTLFETAWKGLQARAVGGALRRVPLAGWGRWVREGLTALLPDGNPFLAKEIRVRSRRGAPMRSLAIPLAVLFGIFLGVLWLLHVDQVRRIAPELGGDVGTLLAVCLSAVHAWMVLYAAESRAREAAAQEEGARMWEFLLATPLRPERIVLLKSVFPCGYAALVALAGLPFYIVAMALGSLSAGDVAGIYVVFGLLGVRFAAPRPRTPADAAPGRGVRRPRGQAAHFAGTLIGILWVLVWFGHLLAPVSAMAPAMPLTWVVLLSRILRTPYPFYGISLWPAVPLLALLLPASVLALRAAAHGLAAHLLLLPFPLFSASSASLR